MSPTPPLANSLYFSINLGVGFPVFSSAPAMQVADRIILFFTPIRPSVAGFMMLSANDINDPSLCVVALIFRLYVISMGLDVEYVIEND
jgi:hypothetical protein